MSPTINTREPAAPARRVLHTFDSLGDPTFRRLLSVAGFYYVYRTTELAVLSWLVLELTGSPFAVALVGVSRITPMFLFGLIAGSLSDRLPRKRLMAAAQVTNLCVAAAMIAILVSGNGQPWHAFAAIFITGTTWAFDWSARRALIADIFRGKALTNATSLDSGLVTGSNMIGPLFGTALIRLSDFGGAYMGIAALMASALVLTLSLRVTTHQTKDPVKSSPLKHLKDAAGVMGHNPTLLAAVLLTAAFNFFGFPFMQMVPVIGRDYLGASELGYGVLVSGIGAGALVGSVLIATIRPAKRGTVYCFASALFLAAAAVFAWSPWFALSLALTFTAGLGLAGFAIMQPAMALEAVGPHLRGRAMGAISLGIGMQAPGMLAMGGLAEFIGPRESVTIVTLCGIGAVLLLRTIYPALRDKPDRRQ
ncbi:MAG: MFS transporter [Dehalococcoidia bacterium]